jgi:hypothetical protein
VPTSEEVLAPPERPSRPVLRAVVTLLVLGLVAWAVVAKLSGGDVAPPAAAPPQPTPTSASSTAGDPVVIPPPPWVRYPNPLEGSWTADSGRLTLVVDNARLTLTDVTHYRSLRYIRIEGHRLHVRPPSSDDELATYRWQITGDRLTFRLLERTANAALRLEALTFHRRA